jgi:hypothetical protein
MADLTAEEAFAAISQAAVDGHVEVRGVVHHPRANGRVTVMSWALAEAESTLAISELTRVADDPDGCHVHAVTPGGRTYRFAAS